jgi:hypothetical protein
MFDVFAQYATDESAENEGVWILRGTAQFRVARSGNRAYGKELTRVMEQNKTLLDMKDEAAEKLAEKLMVEVMARTILVDWKGVHFQKKPMDYSFENAVTLLSVKDFRRMINGLADDMSLFKAKLEEDQVKN